MFQILVPLANVEGGDAAGSGGGGRSEGNGEDGGEGGGGPVKRRRGSSIQNGIELRYGSCFDMNLCRITVVHTRFWKSIHNLLKLVEFRSPRQKIPFVHGMVLLFSLNAAERRKGQTELLMAVVPEILLLNSAEAYARFPIEANECNLNSLCEEWKCSTVQCLVLDRCTVRVAHEIVNLAEGNLGVLRQMNDTTGRARFCLREDLGKTVVATLSTGKRVICTFVVSWPNRDYSPAKKLFERTSDRIEPAGGNCDMPVGAGHKETLSRASPLDRPQRSVDDARMSRLPGPQINMAPAHSDMARGPQSSSQLELVRRSRSSSGGSPADGHNASLSGYQHQHNCCGLCARSTTEGNHYVCSECGANRCVYCYGQKKAAILTGFVCEHCREQRDGQSQVVVVRPPKTYLLCFTCKVENDTKECGHCGCRSCMACAGLFHDELGPPTPAAKRPRLNSAGWRCPTCAGSTAFEHTRVAACKSLLHPVLGNEPDLARAASIKMERLERYAHKCAQLGDLLHDLHLNGFRAVVDRFLGPFMEIVTAQLSHGILPAMDPFHLFYYSMDQHHQSTDSTLFVLARLCQEHGRHYGKMSKTLRPPSTMRRPLPQTRPAVLRIGLYASDLLGNSPTCDLMFATLEAWAPGQTRNSCLEFFIFADGVDATHPPAKQISEMYKGQHLVLFQSNTTPATKLKRFREAELDVLISLTGWTHNHIADVVAAVASDGVLVLSWLGFASLMYYPDAYHLTVAGRALSEEQKGVAGVERERVANLPCYQPCQGYPYRKQDFGREYFNLPAGRFILFYPSYTTRVVRDALFRWLRITERIDGAVLLLIDKPRGMHKRIVLWTSEYIQEISSKFDRNRVIFRPSQKKTYFHAMIRAVGQHGCLVDSVDPIGPHTGVGDGLCNDALFITFRNKNMWHRSVAIEVLTAAGLANWCIANNSEEFVEMVVRLANNKPLMIALQTFIARTRVAKLNYFDLLRPAKAMELIIEEAYAKWRESDGNRRALVDFDVSGQFPAVETFEGSPEAAGLGTCMMVAAPTNPDAETRRMLIDEMLSSRVSLAHIMSKSALDVMEFHQAMGLELNKIVGFGSFAVVVSATARRDLPSGVRAGTKVALKLSKWGCKIPDLRRDSLARQAFVTVKVMTRLKGASSHNSSGVIAKPIYMTDSVQDGKCFWGFSAPTSVDGLVLSYLTCELIETSFHSVVQRFGAQWRESAELPEEFQYLVLRPLFQNTMLLKGLGVCVMDMKGSNMGQREDGTLVNLDLGNAVVFPRDVGRLDSGRIRMKETVPVTYCRVASVCHSSRPGARTTPVVSLRGRKVKPSSVFRVSVKETKEYLDRLCEAGEGLPMTSSGTLTYADQEAAAVRNRLGRDAVLTPEMGYDEDIHGNGRIVAKGLSFSPGSSNTEWEALICQAAKDGPGGISRLLERKVVAGQSVKQRVLLDRLADLLAGILKPKSVGARMSAEKAVTHKANTLTFHSPQNCLALENGTGIMIEGGRVAELSGPLKNHPKLQEAHDPSIPKLIPPVRLRRQGDWGVGAQSERRIQKGHIAAIYAGRFVPQDHAHELFPSLFTASSMPTSHVNTRFICDAAQTRERPFQWFLNNNVAGPFMNGYQSNDPAINCSLDRHSAWRDDDGNVWMIMYALRDIEAGEYLMWNYNPLAGLGGASNGDAYSFDD